LSNPTNRLAHSGYLLGQYSASVNRRIEGLPFVLSQDGDTRSIWIMAIDMSQPIQAPSNNARQRQVTFEAFGCLQAAILDFASRFEDFEVDFNMPSTAIPLDTFHGVFKGIDGDIGQEQPFQWRNIGWWIHFLGQENVHGDCWQGIFLERLGPPRRFESHRAKPNRDDRYHLNKPGQTRSGRSPDRARCGSVGRPATAPQLIEKIRR